MPPLNVLAVVDVVLRHERVLVVLPVLQRGEGGGVSGAEENVVWGDR